MQRVKVKTPRGFRGPGAPLAAPGPTLRSGAAVPFRPAA